MNNLIRKTAALLAILAWWPMVTRADIHVVGLVVQSANNPAGIGTFAPDFSWKWQSDLRGSLQTAFQIVVSSSREKADRGVPDIWNSGKVTTDRQRYIKFMGKTLHSGKTYFWKVKVWDNYKQVSSWSEVAFFTMGVLDRDVWRAQWITYDTTKATALPVFRKPFMLTRKIRRAVAHISGLGYYELMLNGKKVGDHVLDPGQTNYDDFALYVTYDVTAELKPGPNVAGVMLGDGMFNQNKVWGDRGLSYGKPLLIFRLDVEYVDGSKAQIVSDQSWQWANGPVISSNVYGGEVYDARREIVNWNGEQPGWMPVLLADDHPPKLIPQTLPPIRRMKEMPVRKVTQTGEGVFIFDFGQNFAGWTRLKISAAAGTTITIRTAEEIHTDGTLDPASTGVFATKVVQTEQYTCKGAGIEVWEPRFTYHGFRYAEVSGLPAKPDESMLTGIAVYSSMADAGSFSCSNDPMNRLHQLAYWTLISNLHSIPTDCPAREKCGWLGDAHAMGPMSILSLDAENFWIKYLHDIRSSSARQSNTIFYKTWQNHEPGLKPKGIPFMIAPGKREGGAASPDWGTAVVQLPWDLYVYYGNRSVLEKFYPDMKTWVTYVDGLAQDHVIDYGLGDWCPPGRIVPAEPPVAFSSTAFHFYDLEIMERAAKLLGHPEDSDNFRKIKEETKSALLRRFYNFRSKTFEGQTANAMALDMGFVPPGDERAVSDQIAATSKKDLNGFLNTGIFGLPRIFGSLSHYGNESAARDIFEKKGYNSFGYMWSRYDATTLWEILPVDSFYIKKTDKDSERSHNHPMQGGYDKWFYESVLGIRPDRDTPGFKLIHMEPEMIHQLDWAKGGYYSPYGFVGSDWRRDGKKFIWKVTVPPNAKAITYLPATSEKEVTEGGKPATSAVGVRFLRIEKGKALFEIGSGEYQFELRLKD